MGEERIIHVDKQNNLLLEVKTSHCMERDYPVLTNDKETQSCIHVYITCSYMYILI